MLNQHEIIISDSIRSENELEETIKDMSQILINDDEPQPNSRKKRQREGNQTREIFSKCVGYQANLRDVYSDFAFQLFSLKQYKKKFVFENGNFHSYNCALNNYASENGILIIIYYS
jgi:hypothetical protein